MAGDFYRKVVFARKGSNPNRTTQGFYIFNINGELIEGWNSRNVPHMQGKLRAALKQDRPKADKKAKAKQKESDPKYLRQVPKGAVVVDVYAKILKAKWDSAKNKRNKILRQSHGKDHLWILADEKKKLKRGKLSDALKKRIVRFHFIDNTRGEPPVWRQDEVKELKVRAIKVRKGYRIEGQVNLVTADGKRGYQGAIAGFYHFKNDKLARFDLVSRGDFWGCGRYTPNPPEGKFRMGFAFTLADRSKNASRVPPQASRNLERYLKP